MLDFKEMILDPKEILVPDETLVGGAALARGESWEGAGAASATKIPSQRPGSRASSQPFLQNTPNSQGKGALGCWGWFGVQDSRGETQKKRNSWAGKSLL